MAILLQLERDQYFNGQVRLYQGDAWALRCQVVDMVGGVATPRDLTGVAVTGYFPSASGGNPIPAVATLSDAKSGRLSLPLAADLTPGVTLGPLQAYVVMAGPITAQTEEPDLQVMARGFTNPF